MSGGHGLPPSRDPASPARTLILVAESRALRLSRPGVVHGDALARRRRLCAVSSHFWSQDWPPGKLTCALKLFTHKLKILISLLNLKWLLKLKKVSDIKPETWYFGERELPCLGTHVSAAGRLPRGRQSGCPCITPTPKATSLIFCLNV